MIQNLRPDIAARVIHQLEDVETLSAIMQDRGTAAHYSSIWRSFAVNLTVRRIDPVAYLVSCSQKQRSFTANSELDNCFDVLYEMLDRDAVVLADPRPALAVPSMAPPPMVPPIAPPMVPPPPPPAPPSTLDQLPNIEWDEREVLTRAERVARETIYQEMVLSSLLMKHSSWRTLEEHPVIRAFNAAVAAHPHLSITPQDLEHIKREVAKFAHNLKSAPPGNYGRHVSKHTHGAHKTIIVCSLQAEPAWIWVLVKPRTQVKAGANPHEFASGTYKVVKFWGLLFKFPIERGGEVSVTRVVTCSRPAQLVGEASHAVKRTHMRPSSLSASQALLTDFQQLVYPTEAGQRIIAYQPYKGATPTLDFFMRFSGWQKIFAVCSLLNSILQKFQMGRFVSDIKTENMGVIKDQAKNEFYLNVIDHDSGSTYNLAKRVRGSPPNPFEGRGWLQNTVDAQQTALDLLNKRELLGEAGGVIAFEFLCVNFIFELLLMIIKILYPSSYESFGAYSAFFPAEIDARKIFQERRSRPLNMLFTDFLMDSIYRIPSHEGTNVNTRIREFLTRLSGALQVNFPKYAEKIQHFFNPDFVNRFADTLAALPTTPRPILIPPPIVLGSL